MWKTILNNLFSQLSTYVTACAICFFVGCYISYKFTSDHYTAKIEVISIKAEEEKNAIQTKGDNLVAQYVGELDRLRASMANLQRQVPMVTDSSQCSFSLGFVRVFNASTTGEASSPSSTDGSPSTVDEATLLNILIENNEKYNRISEQLIKLQAFENAK